MFIVGTVYVYIVPRPHLHRRLRRIHRLRRRLRRPLDAILMRATPEKKMQHSTRRRLDVSREHNELFI